MSRTSLRQAIIVIAASLVLAVMFSSVARAADAPGSGVTAVMLDTGDLPAGFQPYASMTGPLDGQRARALDIDPGILGSRPAWVRAWLAAHRAEVIETVYDAGTRDVAQAAVTGSVARMVQQGATRQPLAGPVHATAYGLSGQVSGTRLFVLLLPLSRGPYFFILRVYVPAPSAASAGSLMSQLAAAQIRKVPADTPDTAPGGNIAPEVSGGVVGVLIGYLLTVDGVAYLRNPLRRRLARSRRARSAPATPGVTNVSAVAKRSKRTAAGRLAVQFAGLGVAAYAADLYQVRYWYAYLAAGLAIVWAGGRYIHPAGTNRDKNRAIMAGSHRIAVTVMLALASVMILCGLPAVASGALYDAQPSGLMVPSLSGQGFTTVQSMATDLQITGLVLLVLGAIIFRVARRLGAIHARQLIRRDPRPPVLYLRAFGDDRLKLWTATFGRPSLIERFTLRRFDTFEEVLVRHLSRYGPVIAVNPPKTRLAPLGAARETIDSADWQSGVADWMARACLIVFVAPPSQVTPGLLWELETVSVHGYWDKALVIVPPTRPEQLQDRWQQFQAAGEGLWPFTVPGAISDPRALVLAFRNGQWQVTTADRRTEWSYGAALKQALGEPRRLAPAVPAPGPETTPGGPAPGRPTARRRPLTLPVAALIVVLAVAVGGAGSWYAFGNTPVARQSPVAIPSATPSSPSPSATPTAGGSPSASSPSPSPTAAISLAPAAAQYPGAAQITPVITEYFQAINHRDYAGYLTTQSAGNALTAAQFQTGFRSTADSNVLVTGITTAPDGRPAADVTFTSRQQPQDGPDGESCTDWHVMMFFDGNGGNYTIGAPPAYYHASYQAC
jgi:hypothetical protein